MRSVTTVTALMVALILGAAGCGADDEAERVGGESADALGPKGREATCTLKGKSNATVSLKDTGDAFILTFDGQSVPSSGTAGYYADMWDEAGEVGGQIGMQYQNGKLISFFYFDSVAAQQTNLEGEPSISGPTISGTFPYEAIGDLADAEVSKWSAAFTLNGEDVGLCPGGYKKQPFVG